MIDLRTLGLAVALSSSLQLPVMAETAEAPAPSLAEPAPSLAEPAAAPADPRLGPIVAALEAEIAKPAGVPAHSREAAHETADREALAEFYAARKAAPLWIDASGPSERAHRLAAEIANAADYGLDPAAFEIPDLGALGADSTAEAIAEADVALTFAALKYARHARGGRIPDPAGMLNSNLDRKPQMHAPADVLARLAEAEDVAGALVALHPIHPQFERLRRAFLASTSDGKGGGKLGFEAQRLRANMEFWRWMWNDLGELHVFNNIPEFMQYVYRDGEVIRAERIVVGEIGKQTSVYSRRLQSVVLRPRWRVPESIMVHELWPSLLRGGGLMRSYGLEITTKAGEPRNWRTIDWSRDDIRNYHVWQDPGPKSVLGFVKFSFPSQHTIFMHDTPDKWMFNKAQRTLSHGCLRVKNPMELTEILLAYDRGWDREKIAELVKSGPLDNEIEIEKRLPIHLAYFTAWVGDDGKVRTFRDIYGHEKRVRQALAGEWSRIDKGRDHLAPAKPQFDPKAVARSQPQRQQGGADGLSSVGELIGNALGLSF